MSDPLTSLLERADRIIHLLERLQPEMSRTGIDWTATPAARWRRRNGKGELFPVTHPHVIHRADLQGIERQKAEIDRNTRQFVRGLPANNVLLTGARGTGKSSLVKSMLTDYADQGLRLIEVDKADLVDLPDIVEHIEGLSQRFVIFSDDLSFEANDPSYKALKSVLDGSVAARAGNVLVYATSNRRHLLPEYMSENQQYRHVGEEIHPGETTEEKISLSERFGLWVTFYPFTQDQYLEIAAYWLQSLGLQEAEIAAARADALRFAQARGSRSGRVAWQFAQDYAGRLRMHDGS